MWGMWGTPHGASPSKSSIFQGRTSFACNSDELGTLPLSPVTRQLFGQPSKCFQNMEAGGTAILVVIQGIPRQVTDLIDLIDQCDHVINHVHGLGQCFTINRLLPEMAPMFMESLSVLRVA